MKSAFPITTVAVTFLLVAGGAHAGGDNLANVAQTGDRNSALIDQSAGNHNRAGASGLALRQSGSDNFLSITQAGNHNRIGVRGDGLLQQSNRNKATIEQKSDRNRVGEVIQTGISSGVGSDFRNTLSITQQGGNGNLVRRVEQTRAGGLLGFPGQPGNDALSVQNGARNVVSLLSQTGFRNQAALSFTGNRNRASASQQGIGNKIDAVVSQGDRNDVRIDQVSLALGNLATLRISDGDDNVVRIDQDGANAAQISIIGSSNSVSLAQLGSNDAGISIEGNDNLLRAQQTGTGNDLLISIRGNDSNNAPFSAGKASVLASGFDLAPGDVIQSGIGNSIDYSIGSVTALSNGNRFAFLQEGLGNRIVGKTDGDDNEVVIVQRGAMNFTSFVQAGSGNVIAVSQSAH